MDVDGVPTRTIRADPGRRFVEVIDQALLPHAFSWLRLDTVEDPADAIRRMRVRGAPLIGATGAYGMALAALVNPGDAALDATAAELVATRPTAANLRWAVRRVRDTMADAAVANPAVDVTPARLVTALVTERGVCAASADGLAGLYPERAGLS